MNVGAQHGCCGSANWELAARTVIAQLAPMPCQRRGQWRLHDEVS
jgi:hypothetical protein